VKTKPGALALFRRLTSVPTAPFRETAVSRKALEWIRENLGSRAKVRRVRGGFIVSYRGAGEAPALCLAAHLDHPAFELVEVSRTGATARLRGGLPPHLLPGAAVEAFPRVPKDNRPLARGVIGPRPRKDGGLWTIAWSEPLGGGAKPDFAVLALPACATKDGWLLSRSVDDLLGCAIGLEAMRRLIEARAKVNLTVLLNRAEEVGFVGALDMIRSGVLSPKDSYVSIESSRELPGSKPGGGPTVRLGDKATAFDANLTALLDDAAEALRKRGGKVQRLRLTGGTCEATAYLAFGYEAGGVAIPLVNYHNGWGAEAVAPEKVRLSDVEGGVRLVVAASKLFGARILRGALRTRLEQRHDGERRSL
jgi:endoglucanase